GDPAAGAGGDRPERPGDVLHGAHGSAPAAAEPSGAVVLDAPDDGGADRGSARDDPAVACVAGAGPDGGHAAVPRVPRASPAATAAAGAVPGAALRCAGRARGGRRRPEPLRSPGHSSRRTEANDPGSADDRGERQWWWRGNPG